VPAAQAAIGVPDGTELPVQIVWGVLSGAGFLVLLGTGLLAWWLDRRSKRQPARRVPRKRRPRGRPQASARRVLRAGANGAPPPAAQVAGAGVIELGSVAFGWASSAPVPGPAAAPAWASPASAPAPPAGPAAPAATATAPPGPGPVRPVPPRRPRLSIPAARPGRFGRGQRAGVEALAEAGREYSGLRAAAARAATVAAQARQESVAAAQALETAEQRYDQARTVRELSRPAPDHAAPDHAEPGDAEPDHAEPGDAAPDLSRATLDAYRRGELSVEELRRAWYGASGWDAAHEAAEQESLRLRADEVTARQGYHLALAAARAARRAEYVAETALRALAAEAAAAAAELTAAYDRIDGRRGRWRRRD
jgi:hypothetical protein